jgi:hypothetical protein
MIQLATTPKVTKSAQIRDYVAANPKAKSADVAEALGVTPAYVATVMWNARKKVNVVKKAGGMQKKKAIEKIRMEGDLQIEMLEPKADPVNNPAHYTVGGIETIDFIEAKQFGYNLGNVVKYVTRADHKGNKLEDLRKAQWYLAREINSLK